MGTCLQLQNQIIEIENKRPSEATSKHPGRLVKVGIPAQISTGRLSSPCSLWWPTISRVPQKSAGFLIRNHNEQYEGSALSCRVLWSWTDCPFSVTNFKTYQEFQEVHEGAVWASSKLSRDFLKKKCLHIDILIWMLPYFQPYSLKVKTKHVCSLVWRKWEELLTLL